MSRSKSAGQASASKVTGEEIRSVCKLISPYIVHRWRDVCEELGVADDTLDKIAADNENVRMSELVFRALCSWQEMVGRAASKEKLHKAIQLLGLRRADEVLRILISQKRSVPFMGRPATAAVTPEVSVNKQAKQKALADRLSRPKTSASSEQETDKQKKKLTPIRVGTNPLTLQVSASKPSDICEVKLKVTVKAVQRNDTDEMEQTHDDYKSTKDDYKKMCFTFVKLVMANRRAHFRELKERLGFNGISIQRLGQVGFNINVFLLCSSLGAFEILYQNYTTGRLKKIVHSALVTKDHLVKLKAQQLDLSVEMDEGLINKYRDILIVRGPEEEAVLHPVDAIEYFQCDDDEENTLNNDINKDEINNFNLKTWREELYNKVVQIDKRFQEFDESAKDLLLVLRIARPADKQEITCLEDVINCYNHLKYSNSVAARGSRSDIIREYLAIVNSVRILVQEISEKTVYVAFDETMQTDACESFHCILAQVEGKLHPGYMFEAEETISHVHITTGLENEMFGKFLCYVPTLLRLLFSLCDTLTSTSNANETEVSKTNKDIDSDGTKEIEEIDTTEMTEENNNTIKVLNKNSEIQAHKSSPPQHASGNMNKQAIAEESNIATTVNYVRTWTQA